MSSLIAKFAAMVRSGDLKSAAKLGLRIVDGISSCKKAWLRAIENLGEDGACRLKELAVKSKGWKSKLTADEQREFVLLLVRALGFGGDTGPAAPAVA